MGTLHKDMKLVDTITLKKNRGGNKNNPICFLGMVENSNLPYKKTHLNLGLRCNHKPMLQNIFDWQKNDAYELGLADTKCPRKKYKLKPYIHFKFKLVLIVPSELWLIKFFVNTKEKL